MSETPTPLLSRLVYTTFKEDGVPFNNRKSPVIVSGTYG